ncbi:restriction endonuclease subunit S [Vibrio furnissii]|uniref:restriction endonuclease subunit S n=1 Tax=Vibrio furnissii TaxID=29494 RepID=UPI003AA7D89A
MAVENLITEHIDIWTSAVKTKSTSGRGSSNKLDLYGIKKLRELILELAVRGKLVPQDPNDEPASVLLERIAAEKARLVKEKKITKPKKLAEVCDDEFSFELPSNWDIRRLPDVYYTISPSGKKLKSSDVLEHGTYPVIDQGQEAIAGYSNDEERVIDIESPIIIFGDHTRNIKYVDFSFVPGADGTKILCPIGIAPEFFYLQLRSYDIESRGYGRHFKILNENLFVIPSLEEQHRIVAKVDELMTLCDQLEQQTEASIEAHQVLVTTLLDTLTNSADADELMPNWARISEHFDTLFTTEESIDQLKKTILQLAVMGKLVPQDPSDEPAAELLKRIAEDGDSPKKVRLTKPISESEEPLTLPTGWVFTRLESIIQISSGKNLTAKKMDSNGTIPVYGGNGVTGYHSENNVSEPTIVIGRVGFYCGSVHLTPKKAWVTDNAFVTKFSHSNLNLEFLFWLLKATNLNENDSATAQPVISGRKVYPIVVGLPPLNEQARIVAKLNELMAMCDFLKQSFSEHTSTQLLLTNTIVEHAV